MAGFAQRHPVATFWWLAVAIASAVVAQAVVRMIYDPTLAGAIPAMVSEIMRGGGYTNLLTISHAFAERPSLVGIFVFAAAPSIVALWLASRGVGGGLAQLKSRLSPIGPDGSLRRAVWLYAGLLVVYGLGFALYDFVAGAGVDAFTRIRHFGIGLVPGALLALFLDEGGTLEELGWRGFLWPLLQARGRAPLLAAVTLGFLHWAWHLPREAIALLGGVAPAGLLVDQGIFLALCVALAIVAGYCVNVTGGSVWPAVFVHGGSNVWSKALGEHVAPSFGVLDLRTLLILVLALVVALAAGRRLGLRPPP
jgi:hypothetical protein